METKVFEKLGLTKAEVEIYLTLLKIGSSTATKISEKTKLNRSHIYDSLKRLIDKGLVSTYESNNTAYFSPASPETISDYVKDMEKELNNLIPELKKLKEIEKQIPKVQLFQGKNGLKTILQDILRTREDYIAFGEEGQFQKIFPIYIQQFLRDIKHFKIKERLLSKEESRGKINLTSNTQIRYLDNKFLSPTTTVVYGDKVAIFIWTEPYHVSLIKDKEVADSYRNYFWGLWKLAKP
jgi:sugar-specific transcriptional regulator TrmB